MAKAEKLRPAKSALDHLVFGVADLYHGINWLETATGIKAVVGGSHPGGTRNALVSLGHSQYLEIAAPAPDQTAPNLANLRKLAEPRVQDLMENCSSGRRSEC
jgi:hypothetical protein